jgi:hypothetical protein
MSSEDRKDRSHLPIPTPEPTGLITYDASDPPVVMSARGVNFVDPVMSATFPVSECFWKSLSMARL